MNSSSASPQVRTQSLSPLQVQAAAILELRRRRGEYKPQQSRLERYRGDPAGFGWEVLGEWYTTDVLRVMQSVRDNPITIARSCNASGKTHCAGRLAVWFYSMWQDAQVYTTAAPPLENLQRLLWGEIGAIRMEHAELFEGQRIRTLHIERSPKSFLTGVAIPTSGTAEQREAKFAGKHAPHILFIVDEGDAVPDEVYKGIESCMSGGHARLLIMFNPRMQSGPVWRMEHQRRANVVELSAFSHPNVKDGETKIEGAVTRETVVRRINEWTRPLVEGEQPDDSCFKVPAFLVGCTARSLDGQREYEPLPAGWRKVIDPVFFYMVLGRYPTEAENQLISRTWIDAARSRWDAYVAQHGEQPPRGTSPIQGQDVAEFGPDFNVACFRYGGWVAPFTTWNDMDTHSVGVRAKELYDERQCSKAFVDATGHGSSVAPHMRTLGADASSVGVAERATEETEQGRFYQLRDQLWWAVREWLRTDVGAMLPPDEMLVQELATPTYSHYNGRIKVMKKETMKELLKRSPDRADALCLTFAPDEFGGSTGMLRVPMRQM